MLERNDEFSDALNFQKNFGMGRDGLALTITAITGAAWVLRAKISAGNLAQSAVL
jgi:hypothetical protein